MQRRITCRELIDFLDDYVADALPAEQRALFDDHLGRCVPCVRYLRSYQGTMRAVALTHGPNAGPPPDVPEELVTAILEARRAGGA
jgi:hypothetical protein